MHWQRRFLGTGRGELKINEVVAALVRDLAVPVSKVVKRVEAHHQASLTSNLKRFRGQVQEHPDGRTPLVRAETSLLLARCPFSRTPLGFFWWCLSSVQIPSYGSARPWTKAPDPPSDVLTGSSLHGGLQWTRTARAATSVALCTPLRVCLALSACEDGVANGAGPRMSTAGVTPASVRT